MYVICHNCGALHQATFSHVRRGAVSGEDYDVYEVVCTQDGFSDFYTEEALVS